MSDANPAARPAPPPVRVGADEQSRKMRRFLWIFAIWIAWLALTLGYAFVVRGSPWDPFRLASPERRTCMSNLSQLAQTYATTIDRNPAWRPRSGQAMLLAWRKDGTIRAGQEGVLICPGDNSVCFPDTAEARARYDAVNLDAPPADLCSYAVRDFARFPIDPAKAADEPVVACVGRGSGAAWCACHKDTFQIGFADGDVRTFTRADLGIAPGAPPVLGPTSPSPLLRVLCFTPADAATK